MTLTANSVMRLMATCCFVLAMWGVPLGALPMAALGLALWCGSTMVP